MRFHHAGVCVLDLDRSLEWYATVFGFTRGFSFEIPHVGLRGVFAVGPDGVRVELLERAGSVPGEPRPDPNAANLVRGYNHVCFAVDDLDAAYAHALDSGAAGVWEPRDSPEPGVRMAYLADLDGNLIELIQDVVR